MESEQHQGNASSTSSRADFAAFLAMLEADFGGRRCFLAMSANKFQATGAVDTVVVTLDPPKSFVVGVFVRGINDCDSTKSSTGNGGVCIGGGFDFWEGDFGAAELAEHRESLGWEGHTVESLKDCFVRAIQEVAGGQQSDKGVGHQRPPGISRAAGATTLAGEGLEEGGHGASEGGVNCSLDLHYADPDIVGAWAVNLVQRELSEAMVTNVQRSIRAALIRPSSLRAKNEEESVAAKGAAANASSGGAGKRKTGSALLAAQHRRRVQAKGATLVGTQSSKT